MSIVLLAAVGMLFEVLRREPIRSYLSETKPVPSLPIAEGVLMGIFIFKTLIFSL